MFTTTLTRSAVLLATAGTLIGIGSCTAFAAAPTPSAATASAPGLLGSSEGFKLTNDTTGRFVLTSVSGSNEGVPSVGSSLDSGYKQDFEVKYKFGAVNRVKAFFDVFDRDNDKIGTAEVDMSVDTSHDLGSAATFTSLSGGKLPMKLDTSQDKTPRIEDSTTSVEGLDTSDPLAQQLIGQYCQPGLDASCRFTPTSEQQSYRWDEITQGANHDTAPTTLNGTVGHEAGVTDTWGATVSAGADLGGVLSTGVSASYHHSVTFSHSLATTATAQVDAGYTGFIYGAVPVIEDSGTLTITLGNDSWQIAGMTFDSPDGSASAVSEYYIMEEQGDLPAPTTPPTFPPAN